MDRPMTRSSSVVKEQTESVQRRQHTIERMTNEQKGFFLLDMVRNLSMPSGIPEEYIIALFYEHGGFMEAMDLCTKRMLSEGKAS